MNIIIHSFINSFYIFASVSLANFLLDGEQNIKIADFGLAKELGTAKMAQTNVGTPFYMSPELVNEKNYNEKTDIWSLGCLIYELAALRPPFEASNQVALAMKINNGKYSRIPLKYSDALFEVIRRYAPTYTHVYINIYRHLIV